MNNFKANSKGLKYSRSLMFQNNNHKFLNTTSFISDHHSFRSSPTVSQPLINNNNNYIHRNRNSVKSSSRARPINPIVLLSEKPEVFSPSRIFQMRRQQQEKQENTKTTLQKSFGLTSTPSSSISTKTPNQNETLKNRKFSLRKNSRKGTNLQEAKSTIYHYQTPTSNSIYKRSKTAKKQAYNSVFGEQSISISNIHEDFYQSMILSQSVHNPSQRNSIRFNNKSFENEKKQNEKEQFYDLMAKLEKHAYDLNPNRYNFFKKEDDILANPQKTTHQQLEKRQSEIVNYVKGVSQSYKDKNMKTTPIKSVQQVELLDPTFYFKMVEHKNTRLELRNKALIGFNLANIYDNNIASPSDKNLEKLVIDAKSEEEFNFHILKLQNEFTRPLSSRNQNPLNFQNPNHIFRSVLPMKQKLVYFWKNLIYITNFSRLYGIKKQDIYTSLWKKRQCYQLQGSYAFFKFLKNGDTKTIKSFIKKNKQYIYQHDSEQKTCLMHAVIKNQLEIVQAILQVGVNIDFVNENGENALHFALSNNNYQMVQILLKNGCSPWSNHKLRIGDIIGKCSDQIKMVIKNARKVHIGRSLKPKLTEKHEFWLKYKQKIEGNFAISLD